MHPTCLQRIAVVLFFILSLTACRTVRETSPEIPGQKVKREFRGAWIQTAYQGEYQSMSPEELKKDFIRKLDFLQACGINALIFQVRPEADAFYRSEIEPWSRFYTGEQGKAPEGNFDLMKFLIEECHNRSMEFHAWINPYRVAANQNIKLAGNHIYHTHPERCVVYNNQILFDPGIPENREFICRVVRDIVLRYDVDAIHTDDYFYPYPLAGTPFPDDGSFRKYGLTKGYTDEKRNDWRRENVNLLIRELKRTILLAKPWVRFGISPFGIYRNKKSTPDNSGSETNGLQNYDDLYADILLWVRQGWIDYNMPQLYWEIGHPAADYKTLVRWWSENANGRPLYIGQDVARTMKVGQLSEKMFLEKEMYGGRIDGHCFWPANELLWNNNGVADSLKNYYHRYPALIPPYTHLHGKAPKEVSRLKAEWTSEGYVLHWDAKQSRTNPELASYFVIYRFGEKETVDLNDPAGIVAITKEKKYLLPYRNGGEKYTYIITAVDRFHNESRKGKRKKVKL
ncbi:MAG: family 10 glycosylhydrolase [Tannerellaceae bacterium]|jgi:uncharacterized lipoprotein YddW (UPF0748 family)|nr:family 10 glycosylhydrolase [Tannerellaceae bacterium]